jgi:hypothetical protein
VTFERLVRGRLGFAELLEVAGQRAVLVAAERELRRLFEVELRPGRGKLAFEALELELVVGRLGRPGYQGSARYGNPSRNGLSFSSGFGGVLGSIGA